MYVPRFLTEHASLMLRPAGTVIFSMTSVNSGSSGKARQGKENSEREKRGILQNELVQFSLDLFFNAR